MSDRQRRTDQSTAARRSSRDDRPPRARRRRSRRVIWQRRLVAAGLLALLAIIVVVLALRLMGGPPQYAGFWAGSDSLLGSRTWHITRLGGDDFAVTGMKVQGAPLRRLRLDGGKLVAGGSAGGAGWSVTITSAADGNQIVTEYRRDGEPAQHIRFIRVPAP